MASSTSATGPTPGESQSTVATRASEGDGSSGQPPKKRRKGKKEQHPEVQAMYVSLAKGGVDTVAEAYRALPDKSLLDESLRLRVLSVLTGQERWMEVMTSPELLKKYEKHIHLAEELLEGLQPSCKAPQEVLHCMGARMHVFRGDGDAALREATACSAVQPPIVRLRTFGPALWSYAMRGDLAGTLRTLDELRRLRGTINDPGEDEYALALRVLCRHDCHADLVKVLLEMRDDLGTLRPETVALVRGFFEGPYGPSAARQASRPGGPAFVGWRVGETWVDPKGAGVVKGPAGPAGRLKKVTLSAEEWSEFAGSVERLAESQEQREGGFARFREALAASRATVFIDAANIAFYNTGFMGGKQEDRFQWLQVKKIHDLARARFPDRETMVIVHVYRTSKIFTRNPAVKEFIASLKARSLLFTTPAGSNDDWFWLYAAASRGELGVLISNDEMRDHLFELLRPRFFARWRQHHRWTYEVRTTASGAVVGELCAPPSYSTCVQHLPESGAWMLPLSSERWVCAQPVTEDVAA